ncbi:hypothetical protein [Nonomuraea monospora]|uniref:hypothetical protein n=1 Tax=Nonomuraea monospora TaxID=568818 RepID=UPI0031E13608
MGEVFAASLDGVRLDYCTDVPAWEGGFDALAEVLAAFSTDARSAWQAISRVRPAWQLSVHELMACGE